MAAVPCALVSSCSQLRAADGLVKEILGTAQLPGKRIILEHIKAYDWHIDTKYYTADVLLCTTCERTIGDQQFADTVQAFIVHFDSNQESSFDQVKSWLPFLEQLDPVIQILVCDSCTDNSVVSRITAQKWCVENSFELVELEPEDSSDDEEDDFAETTGIKRIIQALHAHTWPNLRLKERSTVLTPYLQQLMHSDKPRLNGSNVRNCEAGCENMKEQGQENSGNTVERDTMLEEGSSCCTNESTSETQAEFTSNKEVESKENGTIEDGIQTESDTKEEKIDSLISADDMSLFAAVGADDPGGESFEQLFEKLHTMKEKAASLPHGQRKLYAEKVALSFWRAIGGDQDEIDGLSDAEDKAS